MEYEYKVIDVADGAVSSFLLGEGRIETGVLEAYINAMASEGWRMVFMTKVMQRHLLVSDLVDVALKHGFGCEICFEKPNQLSCFNRL